jgi:hypothetical protein
MARKRLISPEFFLHYGLVEAEKASGLPLRLGFAGLWGQCDRFGRFRWRPRSLKPAIFPYEDVDFDRVLNALEAHGFVRKYVAGEPLEHGVQESFGYIPSWKDWQSPHHTERPSTIPAPTTSGRRTVMAPLDNGESTVKEPCSTVAVAVADTDAVAVAVPLPLPTGESAEPMPPRAAPEEGARGWTIEDEPTSSLTRFCVECGDGEQFVPNGHKREQTRHRASCSQSPRFSETAEATS